MKWLPHEIRFHKATANIAFKLLNCELDNPHRLHLDMVKNRNIWMKSENKVGHREKEVGANRESKHTFLFTIAGNYNSIPRGYTLVRHPRLFKKWLKLYFEHEIDVEPQLRRKPKQTIIWTRNDFIFKNDLDCQCSHPS